jgi:alkanesulfonate monooxygenase SsuD/methylene tetrahydromethanopterin reductase-like flavin-dependent oxidoreductase (luciferase family)
MLRGPLEERRALMQFAADAGLDHVFVADHISFHTGFGMDGLLNATTLAAQHPTLEVHLGVYLLPLRHPVLVARQLATFAVSAPGRLVFGVGVGGEDRHEVEICGVDPATRGRRADESLAVLRRLLAGEAVTHDGEFFAFEEALILPAPDPPIPIVVGGRSEAAVRRAARHGDGWLGVWCSPDRFAAVVAQIDEEAQRAGRTAPPRRHGLQLWSSFDPDRKLARERLAKGMESVYRIPFERFERYSPYGTPEEVAEFLLPYARAGCTSLNMMPIAESPAVGIEALAEVKRLLHKELEEDDG